jgi:hypothetical protein
MFSHTKISYPSPDARAYEILGLDKYTTFFASSYGPPPDYAAVGIHLLDPVALEATLVVNASADGEVIAAGGLSTASFRTPCAFVDFFSNALWRAEGEACVCQTSLMWNVVKKKESHVH